MGKRLILAKEFDKEASELPALKELVAKDKQPFQDIIIDYMENLGVLDILCMNCDKDILNPSLCPCRTNAYFDDGAWAWNSFDIYYIQEYNVPVPADFLEHVLSTYKNRKELKLKNNLIDRVKIYNNAYLGYVFETIINKDGKVFYKNKTDCPDGAYFLINKDNAESLLREKTNRLFLNRTSYEGKGCVIDGYYWKVEFYSKKGLLYSTYGYQDEPDDRFRDFEIFLQCVERELEKDLGSSLMNEYSTK